ncbi:MAG TPA: aminotransferase class V-fold PLP-dependent enzyme [Thermodesulfobacteriota bacterium]|nr:aminotransferase class V-fold PLP-dependent enzyme [Deltaproteobacteria bacterium]HNU73138.1 aminotransferase class V-fold PLP-dependent enzyme [Thermodesulfobacteriota bacterium]
MFDKSDEQFPIKKNYTFLAHCGVSPLFARACSMVQEISEGQRDHGVLYIVERYLAILEGLHAAAACLMKTSASNISFVKNTSEGMNLIASGYPFSPGDEIVVFEHEYPAVYYPWKLQETRSARLVLLPGKSQQTENGTEPSFSWSLGDLQKLISSRTRVLAISHVQFTSGYAADLEEVGSFCKKHRIDLIIDAAQSLGCLPVFPEQHGIAAVVSSGWKWLLGPVGSGLMYTSEEFRHKIGHVAVGAETMRQGMDYLDHSWDPQDTARRFEYSTSPVSLAAGLVTCIRDLFLNYTIESVWQEIMQLQDIFLDHLDQELWHIEQYSPEHRSGILSLSCCNPDDIARQLLEHGIICSPRAGFVRIAPHFYNSKHEMVQTAAALNAIKMSKK